MEWSSDYEYLVEKYKKLNLFPLDPCPDDDYETKAFKQYLIPLQKIPRCKTCIEDYKRYFSLTDRDMFKANCYRSCLWFDYYEKIRKRK